MLSKAEIRIGIDLMGSDNSPDVLLAAASALIPSLSPGVSLVAIGHPRYRSLANIPFVCAEETIEMSDSPLIAIRRKKKASLCIGMQMLKEGSIHAFVSAGNTGALVSSAKLTLSMLPKIRRPALLALMPTKLRPVAVVDVGANIQCTAEHLVQFAVIGTAYQRARGIVQPTVGLLNIGSEALKGTSELRIAYRLLQEMSLRPPFSFRFAGNVEGKIVFDGDVDVLATDGFTGNVFLKTAEGIASLVLDRINDHAAREVAELMLPQLSDLQSHLHYAQYPGALLCGVRGIVIKCHGYSSPAAFTSGIREAIRIASEGFLEVLTKGLTALAN